jgi:hypothetical protein
VLCAYHKPDGPCRRRLRERGGRRRRRVLTCDHAGRPSMARRELSAAGPPKS